MKEFLVNALRQNTAEIIKTYKLLVLPRRGEYIHDKDDDKLYEVTNVGHRMQDNKQMSIFIELRFVRNGS